MTRGTKTLTFAIASLFVAATPAGAQSPAASGGGPPPLPPLPAGWTQVVMGLASPRGLAVTADGTVYVAESGAGGKDGCIEQPELGHMCFGPSGGISKVANGTATRVVDGLISGATDTGEALGASSVAFASDGTMWYTIGGPGVGAADLRATIKGGEGIGQLYKVGSDGKSTSVADLAAYEVASNPDKDQPGNATPDSNVSAIAIAKDGSILVADSGGNDLLQVGADGKISTVAVFTELTAAAPPDPSAPASPGASPQMIPVDPVPTSVAIGPDGAYYVGLLTGFPFPKGGASVMKVVPGQAPTVYASGLTNVMGVAFAPDGSLYVAEISENGLLSETGLPMGAVLKVPAGGGDAQVVASGLPMPGGIAVGADGTVYVSTCSACPPGAGGIASYKPAS